MENKKSQKIALNAVLKELKKEDKFIIFDKVNFKKCKVEKSEEEGLYNFEMLNINTNKVAKFEVEDEDVCYVISKFLSNLNLPQFSKVLVMKRDNFIAPITLHELVKKVKEVPNVL
jgi:pheromone shutdown protein TraB